jgi:hypothetical protein
MCEIASTFDLFNHGTGTYLKLNAIFTTAPNCKLTKDVLYMATKIFNNKYKQQLAY